MPSNAAAENVLGTIGTILWSIQLAPQLWKSWRRKSTEGLSIWLLAIWAVSGIFLGTYVIAQDINIPLMVQPQCFMFLATMCLGQSLLYDRKYPPLLAFGLPTVFLLVAGGLEAGFVFACRAATRNGTNAPTLLFGVLSAVFVNGGLLPQYYEIWKFKRVFGISFIFLFIDMMGGVFSFLSLVFAGHIDVLAAVSYAGIIVLEGAIFIIAAVINPLYARRLKLNASSTQNTLVNPGEVGMSEGDSGTRSKDREHQTALEKEETVDSRFTRWDDPEDGAGSTG